MSRPEGQALPRPMTIAVLFAALLGARLLAAHFVAFFQNDEVSLAAGAAALARHSIADIYRYGPQAGYYRLVEGLALAFGSLRAIPIVMTWLSALAGTVMPLCGLAAFPDQLSRQERWVLAGLLAVNPILWMSSAYGNSAMPSVALLVLGITWLSNHPGRAGEAAALALYAAAILVRADAVLAFPAVVLVLYQRYRAPGPLAARIGPLVLALAAVYAVLFLVDARMASTVHAVTEHLGDSRFLTHFWDYLLWSTSPFILAFAAVGVRELLAGRRALLACVAAWCLPFFGFYYATTTSPRYFVPTAMPLAVCAAVGVVFLASALGPARQRVAAALLTVLATIHLFVGLSHFSPGSLRNLLQQGEFETQIGPVWTGAFLYKSYFTPWFLGRSVRQPGFGRLNGTQRILDSSLAVVASGTERGHTIAVLLGGWNGHVFHFYAHLHEADYVSRQPGPVYASETWMNLGGARIMSIARHAPAFRAMTRLPVGEGDQVWVLAPDSVSDSQVRSRLPAALALRSTGDSTRPVRIYRVSRSAP